MNSITISSRRRLLLVGTILLLTPAVLPSYLTECRTEDSFAPSKEIELGCDNRNFPEAVPECKKLIADLERQPKPLSPQQRYDLQFALFKVKYKYSIEEEEAVQRKLQLTVRQLVKEFPNDVSIIIDAAGVEFAYDNDDRYLELSRKAVVLAPDCIPKVRSLALYLKERAAEIGEDSPDEFAAIIDERNYLLELGYRNSQTKLRKLHFGGQLYLAYFSGGLPRLALQWRSEVIKDLEPTKLLVDKENIESSVRLMCLPKSHPLILATHCLDLLERAITYALTEGEPVSHFVPFAAESLMRGVTGFDAEPFNPERVLDIRHELNSMEHFYFPGEVAYIIPRLREILELIPQNQQDRNFFEAYRHVIGHRTKIRWLNDMSERNPDEEWVLEELRYADFSQ